MIISRHTRAVVAFGISVSGLFCCSGIPAEALTIDMEGFRHTVPTQDASSFVRVRAVIVPKSSKRSEMEDIRSCDDPMRCLWTLSRRSRETTLKISYKQADTIAISRYIDLLAPDVNREPSNPIFGETEERTVTILEAGKNGLALRKPEAVAAIRTAVETGADTVGLPVDITPPIIGSTDPEALGIRELIAEATTDFRGSPKNRVWNIERALKQFQGAIVAPEAEFSFVTLLGEVDGEHGYLPELVIKNNKTEPEFGGGICQVSTTVFRTAIYAGMKITARRNHAYPISYYKPYGMDATVYVPLPDFRFVNNTPGHVLLVSSIEGTKLTFRFYGTGDGRKVEIDGPHILESNPDGSMKTTFSQKVTDDSGTVFLEDTFPSTYKSPDLYPHPEVFTEKPKDWSNRQWEEYLTKKAAAEAETAAAMAAITASESQPTVTGN